MIHLLCPNPALDRTLLVESYEVGAANRPIEVKDFPGGKSFNVAYAIQQTNLDTSFKIHTLLGGFFGQYVEQLADERAYPLVTTNLETNTRICSIIPNVTNNTVYPLYEKGEEVSSEYVDTFTNQLLDEVENGDILALSGSFLPGFPKDYLEILNKKLQARNVTFCVDTSGEPLKQAYKLNPYLIKINDEELLDIFPDFEGNSVEDYIQFLKDNQEQLSQNFIVTIGKAGVVAKIEDNFYHLQSKAIEAKNPIASGDFFFGTLISNLKNNVSTEDALISAIAASTANCLNWYPEFTQEQFSDIKENYITLNQY